MSDSAIEKLYEEQLQAAQPKLLLYVDGSLKRTEANTPQGRRRMDRAAFEAVRISDDVKVVPVGAATPKPSAGRVPASVPSSSRMQGVVPAPSRTTGCCKPRRYAGPSGVRYRHEFDCPRSPGQPYESPVADLSRVRLNRKHTIQTRRYGLDEAMEDHPAGGTLSAEAHAFWHPGESAEDCIECSERGD